MTKKADTWMPWYVADYLADTAHLSTEQHGAYCLMLMAAWKRGGSLPKDDAQLAAVCRLPIARWRAYRSILLEFFVATEEAYSHKRVTAERLKAQAHSEKKSANGKAGANAKWKDGKPLADGMADAIPIAIKDQVANVMANAMANVSQSDAPSPSPSPDPSDLFQEPNGSSSAAKLPDCPHLRIIDLFGERLPILAQPKPELWGGKNAEAMRARWRWVLTAKRRNGERYAATEQEALDWFGRFFDFVAASDFLTGRVGDFACTLQWLMKSENFEKVVQGNYKNKVPA